jgi:hypothetical protein
MKPIYLTPRRASILACAILIALTVSCGRRQSGQTKGNDWVTVTITEIAVNDIGQVILFAGGQGKMPKIFFKDFYREGVNPEQMREEMNEYARRMERFLNRPVAIRYRIDDSGSMKILETGEP